MSDTKKKFSETKFGSIVGKVAPKVLDIIGDSGIPGVSQLANIIDAVVPDPKVKEELQQQLQDYAQNELPQLLIDLQDARAREVAIATSAAAPLINKIITPVLSIGIILLTFIIFYIVLFKKLGVEKDIIIYILGVLSAITTQIISYYFGSSQGSRDKSETIKKMIP